MQDLERPTPPDVFDSERLAALRSYGILDTRPEEAFDHVVAIASEVCAAPVALISLVAEERQWFKGNVGFDAGQTPIDQSICAHALGCDDILVIDDLTADARTRGNTLVTDEPHVRFYAGAVIRTAGGQALGTVCVLDRAPRPGGLTPRQRKVLGSLARQVMALLEMRRSLIRSVDDRVSEMLSQRGREAEAQLVREQALKLRLAVEATQLGIFDYDIATGELAWDARVRELFSAPPTGPVTYEGSFLAGVHPEDRDAADAAVRAALNPAGPGVFEAEYRTLSPEGDVRWLSARGRTAIEDGSSRRLVGTVRDVTARRLVDDQIGATLERYRLVGRVTKDVIWDWDLTNDHVVWNEALTPAYGYRLADVDPTPDWWLDRVHPDDRARVRDDIYRVVEGGEIEWSHEYRFLRADGGWADVFDRGSVIRDAAGRPLRMIGAMFDNTVRKAEDERQRLLARELSHRMKNLLTVVQSIASQTLRTAESAASARQVLNGRLVALSKAHDVLLGARVDGARLSQMVTDAVSPQLDGPDRIWTSGPDIEIGSKAALPIVLMLHELATNAVKYGALSNCEGRVDVVWAVTGPIGSETLRLEWIERGGPAVAPPTRMGFGTRLIERGLAVQLGATVHIGFAAEGVTCRLDAPLARLREAD